MSKTTATSAAAKGTAAKAVKGGGAAPETVPAEAIAESVAPTPARAASKSAKSRANAAAAAARAIADVPEASTAASRFADRFAPSKPVVPRIFDADLAIAKPSGPVDPKLANAWKHKEGRNLSEAELLAMPEAEYMNDKQLDFFRARLTGLKDDLLSNADETTEHLREDTSIVPDPADRGQRRRTVGLGLRRLFAARRRDPAAGGQQPDGPQRLERARGARRAAARRRSRLRRAARRGELSQRAAQRPQGLQLEA